MTHKPKQNIKKVSPFFTKGIYLYALPLPLFLLVVLLFQAWYLNEFFVMDIVNDAMQIIRLCVVLYIIGVVVCWLIEIKVRENKGG